MSKRSDVQINELRLRVPASSSGEAKRIAEEAIAQVLRELPARGRPQQLGALELRLQVPGDASREAVVSAVAQAIIRQLR
jgi:hypothetical protein